MNLRELSEVPIDTVKVGDRGTVWFANGNCGQGGRIEAIVTVGDKVVQIEMLTRADTQTTIRHPETFVPEAAEQEQERFRLQAWDDWEGFKDRQHEFPNEAAELAYSIGWSDAVRYGERNKDSIARHADSDLEPSWLDPTAVGERWEDD